MSSAKAALSCVGAVWQDARTPESVATLQVCGGLTPAVLRMMTWPKLCVSTVGSETCFIAVLVPSVVLYYRDDDRVNFEYVEWCARRVLILTWLPWESADFEID